MTDRIRSASRRWPKSIIAGVLLLSLATPAVARDTALFVKPGTEPADLRVATVDCLDEARRAPVDRPNYGQRYVTAAASGGLLGVGAVALLSGFMDETHKQREIKRQQTACMRRRGFHKLTLTATEQADYDLKKTDADRDAWRDRWAAGDLSARIAADLPPLPSGRAEPFVYGGLRLVSDELQATPQPVAVGAAVLTGTAHHRRTAKLTENLSAQGRFRITSEPNAVFQLVDFRADPEADETRSSYWCGRVVGSAGPMRVLGMGCIASAPEGYAYYGAAREPRWLVAAVHKERTFPLTEASMKLEESEVDLLGPMDFAVRLTALDAAHAELVASAQRDGKSVEVWRGSVPVGVDGTAVLPFWTHRLVLTRVGAAVQARFAADGDGRGWPEPSPDKPAKPS